MAVILTLHFTRFLVNAFKIKLKVMSGLKRVEAKKCSEETMEASLSEQDDKKPAVGEQTKDKKCDSNTDRSIKNDKNTKENKV